MRRAQQMIDVDERGLRQRAHRLVRDDDDVLAHHFLDPHALAGDFPIRRGVLAERKQRRVLVGRDRGGDGDVHGLMLTIEDRKYHDKL